MKLFEAIQRDMLNHILEICQELLGIESMPPFELINEPFIAGGKKRSFGIFDGEKIQVVSKGRHPIDVMRTLAHEITHWQQRQEGREMDGSDGSDVENEANAMAGVIMRKFAERYPDYFLDSLP